MSKSEWKRSPLLARFTRLPRHYQYSGLLLCLLIISIITIVMDRKHIKLINYVRSTVTEAFVSSIDSLYTGFNNIISLEQYIEDFLNTNRANILLKQENALLKYQINITRQVNAENQELRKLLSFIGNLRFHYVTARVIGNVQGPYMNSALIILDNNENVQKGQVVVNSEGVVGRIIEVHNNIARILLATDINSSIPAMTLDSQRRVILAGNNLGALNMLYLPENSKISEGELVVTSGDGGFFPPGLPIGIITQIKSEEIIVKPIVNFNKLSYISILQYPGQDELDFTKKSSKKDSESKSIKH